MPECAYIRAVIQNHQEHPRNPFKSIKIIPIGQKACECGHTYNLYGLDDEPCPACMAETIDVDDLPEIEQARVLFLSDCFGNGKGSCIEDADRE